MHHTTRRLFPILLALAAWCLPGRSDESAAPSIAPLEEVKREPRTDVAFDVKANGGLPPVRLTISRVRKNGVLVAIPAGMKLAATKGLFSWKPTESQAGTYEVELTATDAKDRKGSAVVRVVVKERSISADTGKVGELLRKWHAEGTAAGNVGDFYDNRDRDHSALNLGPFPQLDHVVYTPRELERRSDWAAQHTIVRHVTFGNSSTSAPVLMGGTNIRQYLLHPRGTPFLYQQYRANNVYTYPGHHDYPANGQRFQGDVFPANTPYLIGSQGSSGTDQPFMRAVPLTLAAFRPEVKKKLVETGLLMPTVQMIFRASNTHLKTPDEYLTGKAHPTIFQGSWVSDLKMVTMAHDVRLETIPPMVQLKVIEEDEAVDGKDYFELGKSEKLFDTPAAIARIVRARPQVRRMVVSAEESFDVNRKPLTFRWVVLRGDAERIRIKPMNETGSVVELRVPYHERRVVESSPLKVESNRVDVGVFVNNGTYHSAPGFVTFYTLDSEARTYDASGRLLEIGHGAGEALLSISRWDALFEALGEKAAEWPQTLLREQFKAEELAALAKLAEEHRTAATKLADLREVSKKANDARQSAADVLKTADAKLKQAQKAIADKPSPEAEAAAKEAAGARAKAEAAHKAAETQASQAQQAVDKAGRDAEALLTQKRPGLDLPAKDLVERVFNRFRDDPDFSTNHRKAIAAVLAKADVGRKQALAAEQKRLLNFGLLKADGDVFAVQSIRSGDGPLAERLTRYEKNLLQRYHAEILFRVLYPQLLGHSFMINFVDQRLAARTEWRDVYHYAGDGRMTGWTRHDKDGSKEFTADGLTVLETDGKGRPTRARSVRYLLERIDPRAAIHTVKTVPGDTVVAIEYGADDKPRVARTEKLPLSVFAAYVMPLEEPWNSVIHNALLAAQQAGTVRYAWKDKLKKAEELESALRERLTREPPDVVFGDAYDHPQTIERLAALFPSSSFVVAAPRALRGANVSVFDNVVEEPAYLCGLIAGKLTKTNVVGVVAGKDEPTTNRNVNAFVAGARAANPRVRAIITYIDTWYAPDKARAAALKQIAGEADLLYAERAGVIEAARDKKVLAFGNLLDRNAQGPETVITGPVWDVTPVVQHVIAQVRDDSFKAEDLRSLSTLAKGGARLADWHGWNKKLPADVLRLVEETEAAIKKGDFQVPSMTGRAKSD